MGISAVASSIRHQSAYLSTASAEYGRNSGSVDGSTSSATSTTDDILDISPAGEAAADAATQQPLGLRSLFDLSGGDGCVTIDDLESLQKKTLEMVQGRLQSLFEQNGIDTSREIRLQVGASGQVIVANDHPQKAQIEKLFADDPTLRDQYVKLTSLTETLGAAQEAIAFQKAYAEDPYAAVAQFSYLFNPSSKAGVSLSILGDKFDAVYERAGAETMRFTAA
jgi:hypothetical protein